MSSSRRPSPAIAQRGGLPKADSIYLNPTGRPQSMISEAQLDITWCSLFTEYEDAIGRDSPGISTEQRRSRAIEQLKDLCGSEEALNSLLVFEKRLFHRDDNERKGTFIHISNGEPPGSPYRRSSEPADFASSHTTSNTDGLVGDIDAPISNCVSDLSIVTVIPRQDIEYESAGHTELYNDSANSAEREEEKPELKPKPLSQCSATALQDATADTASNVAFQQHRPNSERIESPLSATRLGRPKVTPTMPRQTRTSSLRYTLSKEKRKGNDSTPENSRMPVGHARIVGVSSSVPQKLQTAKTKVDVSYSEGRGRSREQTSSKFKIDTRNRGQRSLGSLFNTPTPCSTSDRGEMVKGARTPTIVEADHSGNVRDPEMSNLAPQLKTKEGQYFHISRRKPIPVFESHQDSHPPPHNLPLREVVVDCGPSNTASLAGSSPLERTHGQETPTHCSCRVPIPNSLNKNQDHPSGPAEPNTIEASGDDGNSLGNDKPKDVQIDKWLSTTDNNVGSGIRTEADAPAARIRLDLDDRKLTDVINMENPMAPLTSRTENDPPNQRTSSAQSNSHTTWPQSSDLAIDPATSSPKILIERGSEGHLNSRVNMEPTENSHHGKQGKLSTRQSSAFNKHEETSVMATGRSFPNKPLVKRKISSSKRQLPRGTTLQIGLPDPRSFRHMNSEGADGKIPPMRTHDIQGSPAIGEHKKASSTMEEQRGKSRSYRSFAGLFGQGKGKESATSTKLGQSFLTRIKGTASRLGNVPKSPLGDLSRQNTPTPVPYPRTLSLNTPSSSSHFSPPPQNLIAEKTSKKTGEGKRVTTKLNQQNTTETSFHNEGNEEHRYPSYIAPPEFALPNATPDEFKTPTYPTISPNPSDFFSPMPIPMETSTEDNKEVFMNKFMNTLLHDSSLVRPEDLFELSNHLSLLKVHVNLAQRAAAQADFSNAEVKQIKRKIYILIDRWMTEMNAQGEAQAGEGH